MAGNNVTSSLSIKILPEVARSNPAINLKEVVLPQPEGPKSVVSEPGSKVQLTLLTAKV